MYTNTQSSFLLNQRCQCVNEFKTNFYSSICPVFKSNPDTQKHEIVCPSLKQDINQEHGCPTITSVILRILSILSMSRNQNWSLLRQNNSKSYGKVFFSHFSRRVEQGSRGRSRAAGGRSRVGWEAGWRPGRAGQGGAEAPEIRTAIPGPSSTFLKYVCVLPLGIVSGNTIYTDTSLVRSDQSCKPKHVF